MSPSIHNLDHIKQWGKSLEEASRVMIMIHGRGANASSILELAPSFQTSDMAFIAPQASGNTWYPYSFLAPLRDNEPALSSGLSVIESTITRLAETGFTRQQIYLLGFSQGACLTLEYAIRHPNQYGGIFGLSGGVIGPAGTQWNSSGSFTGTPVFLGCSDTDSHIPKARVLETETLFTSLGAQVTTRLYPHAPHTVLADEVAFIRKALQESRLPSPT